MDTGDKALTLPIDSDAIHREIVALTEMFLGKNGYDLKSLQQKAQRLYQAIDPSHTTQEGVKQNGYSTASLLSDSSSSEEHEEHEEHEEREGRGKRQKKGNKLLEDYVCN